MQPMMKISQKLSFEQILVQPVIKFDQHYNISISAMHRCIFFFRHLIDGLAQDCSNSIANTLVLLQIYAKPS